MWLTKNILDYNKAHPNEKLKFPTAIDLHKLLVALVKSELLGKNHGTVVIEDLNVSGMMANDKLAASIADRVSLNSDAN